MRIGAACAPPRANWKSGANDVPPCQECGRWDRPVRRIDAVSARGRPPKESAPALNLERPAQAAPPRTPTTPRRSNARCRIVARPTRLTDASTNAPRLNYGEPLIDLAFVRHYRDSIHIGRASQRLIKARGIDAGHLKSWLTHISTHINAVVDGVGYFDSPPAEVCAWMEYSRSRWYELRQAATDLRYLATGPAGQRGWIRFAFIPNASITDVELLLKQLRVRTSSPGGQDASQRAVRVGRTLRTSSPGGQDARPGGTVVVKSEIKEREIRTRSTTTTDPNLPDYLEPKPAPIVQDPEIATSRQVRMVRKLAKKLGLEWPTEADARAMSREQADASIQVLVEHEAGGGMTSAAAGLSGAVDALTRPAAPPRKQRPTNCKHPAPKEEHGAWFCDDCGITLRNYTPDLGVDRSPTEPSA